MPHTLTSSANLGAPVFFSRFSSALCGYRSSRLSRRRHAAVQRTSAVESSAVGLSLLRPLGSRLIARAAQRCALDCAQRLGRARYRWTRQDRHYATDSSMCACLVLSSPGLAPEWNSMEHFEPGRTHLLHYTDMPTQPWVSKANPNAALFYRAFAEALKNGGISADLVYQEVELGHVAPDFPTWVGLRSHPSAARLNAAGTAYNADYPYLRGAHEPAEHGSSTEAARDGRGRSRRPC